MKRNFRKVLVFMLIMSILVTSSIYYAEPQDKTASEATGKVEILADMDKNKLFDNLEEKLDKADNDSKLPVIVVFDDEIDSNSTKKGLVKKILGDTAPKYEYKIIPGMAVELTKGQINTLSKLDFVKQIESDLPVQAPANTLSKLDLVKQVEPDLPVQAPPNNAKYWFGVTKAISDFGVTGDRDGNETSYSTSDVVVAVIDTGIDPTHVDLDGGKVIGWKDIINNQSTPYDDHGHGTNCSSVIAGTGEGNSLYKGVAPGAALVGVKVLDSAGSGSISDVAAGIDWVAANKATYGIEVLSLSLALSGSSDGTDSISIAINNAVSAGIVCCVIAGNEGPAKYTIGSPGAAANAITVGAMRDISETGFSLLPYSGRGPTADGRTKPDIVGPGMYMIAAEANSTNSYVTVSGATMTAPFAAGTSALILDANPNLTATQVKSAITSTAVNWGPLGQDVDYGYGRLDAHAAVDSVTSLTGANIALPNHMYTSTNIATASKSDYYTFTVTNISFPIAITLIMPSWTGSRTPDFDLYLYNPSGTSVASSSASTRQETINFTPTVTGTYQIKVSSYAGTDNYFFDISAGGSSLTQTGNDL